MRPRRDVDRGDEVGDGEHRGRDRVGDEESGRSSIDEPNMSGPSRSPTTAIAATAATDIAVTAPTPIASTRGIVVVGRGERKRGVGDGPRAEEHGPADQRDGGVGTGRLGVEDLLGPDRRRRC